MADKIKGIRVKQPDGTYTQQIPISVNVHNVQWDENNHTLLDALGSVDISSSGKGNLQHQIDELDGDKISTNEFDSRLNDFLRDQISADTTDWLGDNVNPVGSAVIVDKTLTIEGAAADAKAVGDELTAVKADLGDLSDLETTNKSSIVAAINEAAQSGGGGGSGGSSTLTGLTDTAFSSVQDGQVLTYNGTSGKWVNRTPIIEVVDTYSDLTGTTAQYVLVENNNGNFGDGGQCWFEKRNGETERTIQRTDGTYVGPVVGQGTLAESIVDYEQIVHVALGYAESNDFVYGITKTLFDVVCDGEIDCSAFVCAVLQGITLEKSRYSLGTSELNKLGENAGYKLPSGAVRIGALNTGELASYFAQHKQLFYFPSNINSAVRMLRVGDIVFTGADTAGSQQNYLGIDHVIIILGISPDYNSISYIQAGGSGTFTNESTVVKTAFRTIDANYPLSHFKAFARPNYGKSLVDRGSGIIDALVGGVYHFDTKFIPNLYCTPATGEMSFSQNFWSDPCFHSVVPGESIVCSTSAGLAHAIFYDSAYNRITNTSITTAKTVPENAKYVRFNIGFAAASGSHVTLAIADGTTITMSLTDKQHLDAVYADYSSAIQALGA